MTLIADLRQCNLDLTGSPPTATVRFAGQTVGVQIEEMDGGAVALRGQLAASGVRPGDLFGTSLNQPGDTLLAIEADLLVGTRTLIQPSLGVLYDAIFDLAKALCASSRLLADLQQMPSITPTNAPPPPNGFSFYVDAVQQLIAGGSDRRVVGTLRPGNAYRGLREEEGWIEAIDDTGATGWLSAANVRRA